MAPNSFAQMPANGSLDALDMDYSLLYWNDSAVWDPNTRRVQWVGGPGTCCADPAIYKMITYDVASDTWSIADTPFEGSGHAYDGNAFDPDSGLHYFARYHDTAVNRWDGSDWGVLPPIPWDAVPAVGLTWFPDTNSGAGALIYVNGYGRTAWFDGSTWTAVTEAEADPWGSYNLFGEYNPVHRIVWMGGGNDADRVSYIMDAQLGMTKLQDAPLSLNNGQALHSCDPVSGQYIVTNLEDQTWWELDPVADSWNQLSPSGAPDFSNGSQFQVPIPECGVILYLDHYNENRTVLLYKH
jgi:hypothetical protein